MFPFLTRQKKQQSRDRGKARVEVKSPCSLVSRFLGVHANQIKSNWGKSNTARSNRATVAAVRPGQELG